MENIIHSREKESHNPIFLDEKIEEQAVFSCLLQSPTSQVLGIFYINNSMHILPIPYSVPSFSRTTTGSAHSHANPQPQKGQDL